MKQNSQKKKRLQKEKQQKKQASVPGVKPRQPQGSKVKVVTKAKKKKWCEKTFKEVQRKARGKSILQKKKKVAKSNRQKAAQKLRPAANSGKAWRGYENGKLVRVGRIAEKKLTSQGRQELAKCRK